MSENSKKNIHYNFSQGEPEGSVFKMLVLSDQRKVANPHNCEAGTREHLEYMLEKLHKLVTDDQKIKKIVDVG